MRFLRCGLSECERDTPETICDAMNLTQRDMAWFVIGTAFGIVLLGEILDALEKKQSDRFWKELNRGLRNDRTPDESTAATPGNDRAE